MAFRIFRRERLSEKLFAGQNVNIANNVKVGNGVRIQNNVSVYEGVELEDNVFCGPSLCLPTSLLHGRISPYTAYMPKTPD